MYPQRKWSPSEVKHLHLRWCSWLEGAMLSQGQRLIACAGTDLGMVGTQPLPREHRGAEGSSNTSGTVSQGGKQEVSCRPLSQVSYKASQVKGASALMSGPHKGMLIS